MPITPEEDSQWHTVPTVRVNCKDCLAECCKHIGIPIEKPRTVADFQQIINWIQHDGVCVYKDADNEWLVQVETRCSMLQGSRCTAWGSAEYPRICAEYDVRDCVMNETSEYWKVMLDRPEQVVAYATRQGIRGSFRTAGGHGPQGCCHHILIPYDAPEDWRDFDDLRWFIAHENIIAIQDAKGKWLLQCAVQSKSPCARCTKTCTKTHGTVRTTLRTWKDIGAAITVRKLAPPVPSRKEALKLTPL